MSLEMLLIIHYNGYSPPWSLNVKVIYICVGRLLDDNVDWIWTYDKYSVSDTTVNSMTSILQAL